MTAAEAHIAALLAEQRFHALYHKDTLLAQEWMVEPFVSPDTQAALFVWEGLFMHYKRMRDEERAARKERRVRRRLQEEVAS